MPKCDFNKVARQLYLNRTLPWVLYCKFFLRTPFSWEHLWTTASEISAKVMKNYCLKTTPAFFTWRLTFSYFHVCLSWQKILTNVFCPLAEKKTNFGKKLGAAQKTAKIPWWLLHHAIYIYIYIFDNP